MPWLITLFLRLNWVLSILSKALADTDYPAMLTTEKRIRTLLNNCKQEETTHPRHSEIVKQRNPYIFVVALHVTQH